MKKRSNNFIFSKRYRLEVTSNGFILWDMKSKCYNVNCERWMIDGSTISKDGRFLLGMHKWSSFPTVKEVVSEYCHNSYEAIPKHIPHKKRKGSKR